MWANGHPATFMLAPGCSPWRPQSEPTTSRDAVTDGGGGAGMRRASNRRSARERGCQGGHLDATLNRVICVLLHGLANVRLCKVE
jgi:hypothetical protein